MAINIILHLYQSWIVLLINKHIIQIRHIIINFNLSTNNIYLFLFANTYY